jgi:hypothetical protein
MCAAPSGKTLENDMEYLALTYSLSLLVAMLVCLELGRRYGLRNSADESEKAASGKRIIEGAFFGLLSLLLAFSFSGAVGRFDHRRELIIEEANDIGTAYLRVDMLAPDVQPKMRDLFRRYLDDRLAVYRALPDIDAAKKRLDQSIDLQNQIWGLAVASTREATSHPDSGKLLLPALNSMIDISNSRTWAALTHPPVIIFIFLFFIALVCAFIAGGSLSAAKSNTWVHRLAFALLMCVSVYVILEIEYPRIGFINIERYDRALVDVRSSMK